MIENYPFLNPMPRVIAHRGDSINYPENTLSAFLSAANMKIDVIETDVHLTKDNFLVIWHDSTLERNTNGSGLVTSHTLAELKELDAAYTFTKDGGKTFPFRGEGIKICTLEEALTALPNQRFNVDLKDKGEEIVDEFIKVLTRCKALDRVCGASFHLSNLKMLREKEKRILTSISTMEVLPLLFKNKLHLLEKEFKRQIVFQVPVSQWGIKVITPRFVEEMHKRGAVIMVWTINEEEEMRRLFKMGVDSIMTDDPELVIKVEMELNMLK